MGAGISEQVWIDSWPGTAGGELLLDSVTVYPMAGNDLALQATLKGTRYREDTGLTERQFPDAGMRRAPPGPLPCLPHGFCRCGGRLATDLNARATRFFMAGYVSTA
jgi:hypothetical protein